LGSYTLFVTFFWNRGGSGRLFGGCCLLHLPCIPLSPNPLPLGPSSPALDRFSCQLDKFCGPLLTPARPFPVLAPASQTAWFLGHLAGLYRFAGSHSNYLVWTTPPSLNLSYPYLPHFTPSLVVSSWQPIAWFTVWAETCPAPVTYGQTLPSQPHPAPTPPQP